MAPHIDENPLSHIIELIIPGMFGVGYNSNSIMFMFISPQQLALTPVLLDALFKCQQKKTLRLVAIDEAHIYAQHGWPF